MATIELTVMTDAIDKYIKAVLDKAVRELAVDGVLMFPYCPDCKTVMKRVSSPYKGREYPTWECQCSLDRLRELMEEEVGDVEEA